MVGEILLDRTILVKRDFGEDKKYKHRFTISSPERTSQVLSPAAIKDDLSFIKEKKRWGVHFRGGIVKIPYEDFEKIKKNHYLNPIQHLMKF